MMEERKEGRLSLAPIYVGCTRCGNGGRAKNACTPFRFIGRVLNALHYVSNVRVAHFAECGPMRSTCPHENPRRDGVVEVSRSDSVRRFLRIVLRIRSSQG